MLLGYAACDSRVNADAVRSLEHWITPACSSDTLATKQTNQNTGMQRTHFLPNDFLFQVWVSPRLTAYCCLITVTKRVVVKLSHVIFISRPSFAPYLYSNTGHASWANQLA